MPAKKMSFPISLLLRQNSAEQVRAFFKALDESFRAAFADAERICPAERSDRPSVNDRGNNRRNRLDRAFRASASIAKFPIVTKYNSSATWCYPVVQIGPYSITQAIVDRPVNYGSMRIRCRGRYMRSHVANNDAIDPQKRLEYESKKTKRLIPNGSVGAVIAVEPSMLTPDTPNYVGFYIPTENLSGKYYRQSLDKIVSLLDAHIAEAAPQKSASKGRIKPALRRDTKRKKDGDRS